MSEVTLVYRTEVAGNEVQVRDDDDYLKDLFKELGGRVDIVTDKSLDMVFPNAEAAQTFREAAVARGAMFD